MTLRFITLACLVFATIFPLTVARSQKTENATCQMFTVTDLEKELRYQGFNSSSKTNNISCWIITAEEGYLIEITLHQLRSFNSTSCESGSLVVHDGKSESSSELVRFCPGGNISSPHHGLSSGSSLFLRLQTNKTHNSSLRNGFHLTYRRIEKSTLGNITCRTVRVSENAASLEFDTAKQAWRLYNVVCWKFYREISDPKGLKLSVSIHQKLADDIVSNCDDYLQIIHEDNSMERLCHSEEEQEITSKGNSLFVLLHHTSTQKGTVVRIEHRTEDKGAVYWVMVLTIIAVVIFTLSVILILRNTLSGSK